VNSGIFKRLERRLRTLLDSSLRGRATRVRLGAPRPALSTDTVLFAVPTLFNRPKRTVACVDHLHKQIVANGANHRIAVVINEMTDEFDDYDSRHSNVRKYRGNLRYSVSRALNTAIQARTGDERYFCYVDEGIRPTRDDWFSALIRLYAEFGPVGAVGCRKHSTFHKWHRVLRDGLYEVLWSDGFLFVDFDRFDKVGTFDEAYFADREIQDFCYRLHDTGFRNLCVSGGVRHEQEAFPRKVSQDRDRFLSLVAESRAIFARRWGPWEAERGLSP
jgi:glycosyltransferase involved in cell wall biosynthesis